MFLIQDKINKISESFLSFYIFLHFSVAFIFYLLYTISKLTSDISFTNNRRYILIATADHYICIVGGT